MTGVILGDEGDPMSPMNQVVHLEGVTRRFGHAPAAVDVTFDVHAGEIFGLLGHNGAGKTTLIRLVNGLLVPDHGTIATFGLDPVRDGHTVRRRTGVLTTYPGLDDYLSPAENLAVYAAIHGLPADVTRQRTVRLLARLGLDPRSTEPVRGLSAGLKQRVALARALIHDPDLLLLDEPTANLDPVAARGVRDLVRDLAADGRTVVFSSHNLAEAEHLCDRVAILREGRVLAVGSLGDLAGLGHGHLGIDVVVGPDQGEKALGALQPHLNGHRTSLHGDRLSIWQDQEVMAPYLIRVLVGAGIDIHAVVPRAPSLEDVYFALHTSGDRR